MKLILEQNNLLFIHDTRTPIVRVLNLKTGVAKETENPSMVQKVVEHGEEVPAISEIN